MGFSFPQSEQVKLIGSRTVTWLITLQECTTDTANFSIKNALRVLTGLWICEKALLDATECSHTKLQAQKICAYTASRSDIFADLLRSDPPLVLISLGILRYLNMQNHQLETFAKNMSKLLQEHADQNEIEADELFTTRFLLHRLRLHAPLQSYSVREMSVSEMLLAKDNTVKSLVKSVIAATRYGQIALAEESKSRQVLYSILPILMAYYFRIYNLELGMELFRCIRYLNISDSRDTCNNLEFLIAQQQPDGRFGFLADEIAQLSDSKENFEYDLAIFLPHTVSFLWTVAEVTHPHFILPLSF